VPTVFYQDVDYVILLMVDFNQQLYILNKQ